MVNRLTDQQLLREYAERTSEAAFAELLRRHIDFVYSAALRMLRDGHLAEDVTQGVFLALAKQAGQLATRPALSGWLLRTARNLAANMVRADARRRAREQNAIAMTQLTSTGDEAGWEEIAPHLDDALNELSDEDRDAVVSRYFQRRPAREIAEGLGISEDAAQKRITRAIERLRTLLAARGVTASAGGFALLMSLNAVQAAPLGLSATITAALGGATGVGAVTAAATKAITMTTFQKALVATAFAAAIGTGVHDVHQTSAFGAKLDTLRRQQTQLAAQLQQVTQERDEQSNRLAVARQDIEQLRRESAELSKLREEARQFAAFKAARALAGKNPVMEAALTAWASRAEDLWQRLKQAPDKGIPELQLCDGYDWLEAVKNSDMRSEEDARKVFSRLRQQGKMKFGGLMEGALEKYVQANQGRLPTDPSQLKEYCDTPVDDTVFARYKLLHTGNMSDLPPGTKWVMTEKAPVDRDYDSRLMVGPGTYSVMSSGVGEADENGNPVYGDSEQP